MLSSKEEFHVDPVEHYRHRLESAMTGQHDSIFDLAVRVSQDIEYIWREHRDLHPRDIGRAFCRSLASELDAVIEVSQNQEWWGEVR